MTPAQAQAILRRLDAAKTLADKAWVLAQVGGLVAPACPEHPSVQLTCHACLSARGGRRLTDAKRAQLQAASRRPRPGARKSVPSAAGR